MLARQAVRKRSRSSPSHFRRADSARSGERLEGFQLERERSTVEPYRLKLAVPDALTDPARRTSKPVRCLFEIEQTPAVGFRRRYAFGQPVCYPVREVIE